MELRPYQSDLINNIRQSLAQGHNKVCAVLGCGGGKSFIQASIAKAANERNNRVLYLIHRKELASQIEATFYQTGVNPELCDIQMVQTATRRISKLQEPKLIIVDEAHHILATGYKRIMNAFPAATVLGFTATPARMNEGGLGEVFEQLITSVPTKWLIANGYLANYRYYSCQLVDTKGLHTVRGDYNQQEVEALMGKPKIYGDTVLQWKEHANNLKTIVYCSSIATSEATARAFSDENIPAQHLDGTTPKKERDEAVSAFREGKIKILCNVDLFGEGFDVPDCECVVLLRPTKSLTLFIQQSMRSMRADPNNPNKTAIIIDHVGNYLKHGLPDDDREWTLEAKKSKKRDSVSIVKMCPNCFSVVRNTAVECPWCHLKFEKTVAMEPEKVDSDLVEVYNSAFTNAEMKQLTYDDVRMLRTWEELEQFCQTHTKKDGKKYSFAWRLHKAVELDISLPLKYRNVAYKMGIVQRSYVTNIPR